MNLVLDFGNTRVKAAVFRGDHLENSSVHQSAEDLAAWLKGIQGVTHCLVASVTSQHEPLMDTLRSLFPTILFTKDTAVPIKNLYESALTLGSDRLAVAVGAYTLRPNTDVLTIDAGTCVKYNFMNARNEYLGGAISPGIQMRLKAMHHYTDRLPLVHADLNYTQLIGKNSNDSLLSGALTATVCEADGMIQRYQSRYPGLEVIVTGGDGPYLCKQLKSRFFASQNLLLLGLNTILNFNLEK